MGPPLSSVAPQRVKEKQILDDALGKVLQPAAHGVIRQFAVDRPRAEISILAAVYQVIGVEVITSLRVGEPGFDVQDQREGWVRASSSCEYIAGQTKVQYLIEGYII